MDDALAQILERSRDIGFLGPGSVELQRRHAEAFMDAIGPGPLHRALDLGSGGGLPGLVLAMATPGVEWVLVDSMQRRTRFLEEAVTVLELGDRASVVTARAEELGRTEMRGTFDLVVARGFGPPPVVAECAAPLLQVGGQLVVSEPPESRGERWASLHLDDLGLRVEELVDGPPSFIRLRQDGPAPMWSPRRNGVPAKRPLW